MHIISTLSLSGGMGKTTSSFFIGQTLADLGYKVLLIDSDPQSNLTFYLSVSIESDEASLLEVINETVTPDQALYKTNYQNLYLIPSDDALNDAQDFLAKSGVGAFLLKDKLEPLEDLFDFCIIDSPPQRSQISLAVIGAADYLVVPIEVSSKGINSMNRTLDLISSQAKYKGFSGKILGILPFRERWVGRTQTKKSRESISAIKLILDSETRDLLKDIEVLPSIIESEQFKKAIDTGKNLEAIGHKDLAYPFEQIAERLISTLTK